MKTITIDECTKMIRAARSVAQAAAALDNYRCALGIATFIEALTQGMYIAVAK